MTLARATGAPSASSTRPRKPPEPATGREAVGAGASSSLLASSAGRIDSRCDGRNEASTSPISTAPVAIRNEMRNPSIEGSAAPPTWTEVFASTMPITALDTDVPIDRIRVFRPLAAPVSDGSTAPMISAGSEEYASPMPAPSTTAITTVCQAALISPCPAP